MAALSSSTRWHLLCFFCCCCSVLVVTAAAPKGPTGNISRVEDAENFHIYYGQSFKVIKNGGDGKSYLLTQLLGLVSDLKGITSDSVTSQCILKAYSEGNIVLVNKTDVTRLLQFSAHFISNSDTRDSCNFATVLASGEDAPLQRAEWIKYVGAFMNSEGRANQVFDAVKANYMCLMNSAAKKTTSFKPVVAWLQHNEGIWSFTQDVYKLKLVADAGGENVDDTITKKIYNVSTPEDLEDFHAILCMIDVVIDETFVPDAEAYNLSRFIDQTKVEDASCFAFLTNQSLWRYDKRTRSPGALDWLDGGLSQPQLVLADLMEAFFPTGNYTTTYFRNLAKEEGVVNVGPEMCERDSSMPMEPNIIPCQ